MSVQTDNNRLSSIEEQLQNAYLQSKQNNKSRKKKKNEDLILLENLKKGESIHKADDDATLLANTYDPDIDPKNTKSNRQRQRQQETMRENPAFEDSENEIIPTKAKGRKKQSVAVDRRSPARLVVENEVTTGSAAKKKTRKSESDLKEGHGPATTAVDSEAEAARPTTKKKTLKKETDLKDGAEHKQSRQTMKSASQPTTTTPPPAADEPLASPTTKKKTRGAKSKSKPQHDDMGQTTGDEVDADTSNASALPPAKPRRKKKAVHKADTDEEHIADEPATMLATAAADNDRILQVTIHRTDKLKADFYIAHPLIRVHIIDLDTGACLKKQQKDRRVSSFFETENKNVDFILPIMTLPFDFKEHQSTLPIWEENIVFNENFDYLCQKSLNVMLFFEVMDFVSMKTANKYSDGDRQDGGWHHIAWAFLKLIGANGKPNIEKKVRLQLYNPPNGHTASRDGQPQVVSWWKSTAGQRIPYPSTLYVTVKPITGPMPVDPAQRSMCATQQEQSPQGYEQLPTSTGRRRSPLDGQTYREPSLWSRLPGQQCKIPNNPTLSLGAGRKGCFILRFSRNGKSLACGCHDKDSYPIYIYEIPSGQLKGELTGHYRIIYDLCWSKSDHGLLSASADGTVRVWDIEKMARSSCKLLPHPSFVYTARYHSHVSKIVVTGGFDRLIRIWNLESDSNSGILLHELDGHLAFVNALCFNDDGDVLYSGDSLGNIHVWNVRVADTDAASAKGTQVTWSLQKEIAHKDIVGNAINVLQTHPSGRRLLVHTRNNMIQMLDLRTDTVMCKYVGALNFREHIRSTLTPCGSFLFSGSEDGQAYVWNAESGDLVYIYSKLGFCNAVCDVTFHPLDNIVAFCSYGESHLIKLYSYDQKAVRKDLTFDVGEALGDTSLKGASPGLQTAENTVAPLGFMDTAMDLSLMQSARMHQVMAKLRSVSALHSTRRDEPSSGLDLTNASGATMTMMRSDWLPGSVGEQSSLLLSYRQPKINLTRTTGKSQLTVQDPLRRRDKPLEQVTVVYDYQAQRSDELSLKRGDRVNVLFKDNENWWMGELADGQQGFFPSNYVVEHESKLTRDSDVDTDTERQTKVHAVRTKSGELKFLSAAEDSDTDVPSNAQKRRMKSSGPVRRQESIDRKEIPSKRS